MLVLQILTAALTISFAKANPLVVDVRNWENPTADGTFERGELDIASPASNYAEYIPSPTETSLTYHYYQERATCLDQFVWYCQIPMAACIASLKTIPSPATMWSLVPCVIAALCGTVTLVLGALCCNGVIQNCASIHTIAASTQPLTGNVMASLNGGQGRNAFTRATVRSELDSYLKSKGSKTPSDSEFNGMYDNFLTRTFCSNGPGEGGPSCLPASVSFQAVRSHLFCVEYVILTGVFVLPV
ncbi:GPI-anchored small secreted protein [Laccaria bicolor S238N-H82]|uniref:GPI-anchored small secreted protein n=1 Tax=Laccaria bicolor (strain S238N-H82 / ATCC MYA-4686) TaxID=486041 RepID=B0DB59_LACBS|nr:GPI-anchored small secreted protein [Laccaria bicolor S238N-H82]EDR08141.1 GPI-anchored small secreted protein [Laccaria bicolor S238N-H82]|eukprot:XP_001881211.1 GPI-anchored small secreted protein [Laccaria bicolor S238N-H82]